MQIKIVCILNRQDIEKSAINALACYSLSKDEFNSGTQQRARAAFFTEEEQPLLEKIITRAEAYWRKPTQTMELSPAEYALLDKIEQFLDQHWAIH